METKSAEGREKEELPAYACVLKLLFSLFPSEQLNRQNGLLQATQNP